MIAKEDVMPDFAKFDQSKVQDVWQNCIVLIPIPKTDNKPQRTLQFKHIGDKVNSMLGDASVGSYVVAKARQFAGSKIISRVEEVIESPKPIEESGKFINKNDKVVKYRSCLLPFGNEYDGVTHILVGLSWREF
jgi:hypothetical protein